MDDLQKQKAQLFIEETKIEANQFVESFPAGFRKLLLGLILLTIPLFFISRFVTAKIYANQHQHSLVSAYPAVINPEKIEVQQVKGIQIFKNSYAAYTLVKNPNPNLVVPNLKYTFSFHDDKGQLIDQVSGKSFILGGETKYIVLPRIDLSRPVGTGKDAVRVTLNFDWKMRLDPPKAAIETAIRKAGDVTDPISSYSIDAYMKNVGALPIQEAKVNVIVLDSEANVIAVTQRTESDLKPGSSRDFKLVWPVPIQSKVQGKPLIYSETNILDYDNLH
jgi:hypothetical protein